MSLTLVRPHGVPTRYAGVNFRSRLEARWAAFFDLSGWRWDYEPLELAGYVPDFVLSFKRPLLVEVKPFMGDEHLEYPRPACDCRRCLNCTVAKIDASGWHGDALIVGNGAAPGFGSFSQAGWHGQAFKDGEGVHAWGLAEWGECDRASCRGRTVVNASMSWNCSRCGDYLGKGYYGDEDGLYREVTMLWREAGNRTQWRPA